MTLYGVNRALWQVYRFDDSSAEFAANPEGYVERFPLERVEREIILSRDLRALFEWGAHPFLVYSFAMRLAGGFSLEFAGEYLGAIGDLQLREIET